MFRQIEACRICGNRNLRSILHLGEQYLTGVFPKSRETPLTKGPLELVKCIPDGNSPVCGLVQLNHSYDLEEMYGDTYGYRSGLNASMVKHLQDKANRIGEKAGLKKGDVVLDIGSNDGTLLLAYNNPELDLYGVDPSAEKLRHFYPDHVNLITEFFPSQTLSEKLAAKKAKVVTSISMFYDLEQPIEFVKAVHDVLDKDGIWVFEQSYLPKMLQTNAYDTVCHEHLEYYCVRQIKWMMDRVGFNIVDIELNEVNGGSFSLTVARKDSSRFKENSKLVGEFLAYEARGGFDALECYADFRQKVLGHRKSLVALLTRLKNEGKKVIGYGASTKGNVMLQYCNITTDLLPCIAEVNEDKFDSYTPGTNIPIISEAEARKLSPDYYLVMPWHFKENFLKRERQYLLDGGKLIFPLPQIDIVSKDNVADSGQ